MELVEQLLAAPLDVTQASSAELTEVPGIGEQAADIVATAREREIPLDSLLASAGVPKATLPMLKAGRKAEPRTARCCLRWCTDTLVSLSKYSGRSVWFDVSTSGLRAVLLAESDRREPVFPDWFGGGLIWRRPKMRTLLGDFVAGIAHGLVLAAPHAASALLTEGSEAGTLALPRYALESRGFRGVGFETEIADWRFGFVGSLKPRDARLNPDGTVLRLVLDGVHAESARIAEKERVVEQSATGIVRWRCPVLTVGAVVAGQQYSRRLSPADSLFSFAGHRLAQMGIAIGFQRHQGRILLELARSSGGGNALALVAMSRSRVATASAGLRTYGPRFFAPLGRRPSLVNRKSRTEADVRLRFRLAGLEFGVVANTYREYQEDSLPAGLRLTAGYGGTGFRLSLAVGRRFRLVTEQSRTADLLLGLNLGSERLEFRFGDEYSESRGGRGMMCAGLVSSHRGAVDVSLLAAGFAIQGSGVRMSVSEPGAGRIRSAYSTSRSGWRVVPGLACRFGRAGRIGIKVGWELQDKVKTDVAGELQFGIDNG